MSKYIGSTLVAGVGRNTESNAYTLFDFKWSDHIINSMEWLRADTFSWQSGSVYTSVYNHLVADIASKTLQSETVGGVTVQFYLANDGHKICPANQESNVANIFSATGVAWYYILDTSNTRFKLPRTKFGFTGLRDAVGKYVAAGLPNITGHLIQGNYNYKDQSLLDQYIDGAFEYTYRAGNTGDMHGGEGTGGQATGMPASFNASRSSSIYGNSTTVQPPATQMYLYFYVGQFSQSATAQTAGLNASLFNGKADLDLSNITANGKEVIAHNAMPSDRHTVLTLGASGATYTAPTDGWFVWNGTFSNNKGYMRASVKKGSTIHIEAGANANAGSPSEPTRLYFPASKSTVATINYNYLNETFNFAFIYANGAQ